MSDQLISAVTKIIKLFTTKARSEPQESKDENSMSKESLSNSDISSNPIYIYVWAIFWIAVPIIQQQNIFGN